MLFLMLILVLLTLFVGAITIHFNQEGIHFTDIIQISLEKKFERFR